MKRKRGVREDHENRREERDGEGSEGKREEEAEDRC